MKFVVFVKGTAGYEAGAMPTEALIAEMTAFNEELSKAGIIVMGEGLHPSSDSKRIAFHGNERTVIDGPFAETKELVAGFWIWECASMDEAMSWAKRCPKPHDEDCEIEIRQVFTMDEFGEALTPELRAREDALRVEIEKRRG
ncbi:YciI family protein [Acuticoccus kandeliae]|uniref:YciI family protein n=1 Tax=Acuticoccus kandeliae TaxID=2073160 RepID=UPI000D3E7B55|nr:YciI family protein [Acuticoccus kandeliae]